VWKPRRAMVAGRRAVDRASIYTYVSRCAVILWPEEQPLRAFCIDLKKQSCL